MTGLRSPIANDSLLWDVCDPSVGRALYGKFVVMTQFWLPLFLNIIGEATMLSVFVFCSKTNGSLIICILKTWPHNIYTRSSQTWMTQ